MNQLIDNILGELKAKYGISKTELEKMIDSQFKVTVDHMESSDLRTVKWIHLGKIRPSEWFTYKTNKKRNEQIKGDTRGVEERSV